MTNLSLNLNALNALTVVSREYGLVSGFFWVEFENGKSLQCCLREAFSYYGIHVGYEPQIDINDTGFNVGINWDNNQWAAGEYGEAEHIEEFLIEQAKQAGLEIII